LNEKPHVGINKGGYHMNIHSSHKFTFDREQNIMIGEISELARPVMGQVYPDACDIGFTISSVRTGRNEKFRLCEEKTNENGEATVWILEPVNQKLRQTGLKIHLLND
jgi:hypothetical protein